MNSDNRLEMVIDGEFDINVDHSNEVIFRAHSFYGWMPASNRVRKRDRTT